MSESRDVSPKPLIPVFVLREKINVFSTWRWLRAISTPKSEKCPQLFNDCAKNELSMRSRSCNVTDYKKTIFNLILQGQVVNMTVQRIVPGFCMGSIWGWNLETRLGYMSDGLWLSLFTDTWKHLLRWWSTHGLVHFRLGLYIAWAQRPEPTTIIIIHESYKPSRRR